MNWTIEPHGKGFALYSGRDDMRHGMNLVYLSEPDGNWEKTKALIEAAPELLAACELASKDMEWGRIYGPGRTAIENAIKKAKGE